MALDEATAYALAAWEQFDAEIHDEVLRAVCAAFALVAVADGYLDERESERFMQLMRERFRDVPKLDLGRIERWFHALADAIQSDPAGGRERAIRDLARMRGREDEADMVRSAARLALIADERIDPTETRVFGEICDALELPHR